MVFTDKNVSNRPLFSGQMEPGESPTVVLGGNAMLGLDLRGRNGNPYKIRPCSLAGTEKFNDGIQKFNANTPRPVA